MQTPEISVIMPVYNAEPFLKESIESILNQTHTDFELLLLNDKSTDNSLEIILEYKQKDSRIIVINKESNVGPANIRNEGIFASKGRFIALMDADDISLPNRFERQVDILKKNPEIGVCGSGFTFFGLKKNVVTHSEKHDEIKVSFLHSCSIGNPTVMLRKDALSGLIFDNSYIISEDYDLWTRLITKTKFYNIPESLLLYRWHTNNISKTRISNEAQAIRRIKINQLKEFEIEFTNPKIDSYLNAISVKRGLMPSEIIEAIKASKFLFSQNEKLKKFDHDLLEKHINRTLIRTIRNADKYNISYYNYLKKNESELFQKINKLDKIILFLKSIFRWKKQYFFSIS
ncbi:glycosyltransferase family 2 protein [Flavobacterium sp. LS1R47]|uniref:Glycosyltransferase family 2 protein n=1 Tax=Flavobacterium frigoritolerans TaxID=2987686 RepID=A0A9X2ZNI3_9FLAO|nr:glycosyltransferase family 2 protein [Flavobacterium frigoritolerans]MCV9931877.1 glycosyltransferase family 2 protein [Flavobacterium frigoritolerans]